MQASLNEEKIQKIASEGDGEQMWLSSSRGKQRDRFRDLYQPDFPLQLSIQDWWY